MQNSHNTTSTLTLPRLAIGALQGCLLYFLYRSVQSSVWPANVGYLFAPLLLCTLILPLVWISGLGTLNIRSLIRWTACLAAIVAALAIYDIWRNMGDEASFRTLWWLKDTGNAQTVRFPSGWFGFYLLIGCYIAHALVLAGAMDTRWIASYPAYFESGWKLLIQVIFSSFFVLALWLVLWLGAALFTLVKLDFFMTMLKQSWFSIPVTAFAFSCALHLTDVRPGIIRGIRGLLLVLLSWILPVTSLIVLGFLLSLTGTGLAPLWATRHATLVLLGATAVLIVLINAAFQNGTVTNEVARMIRISARIACFLLLPLTAIAGYALQLRVAQYGWTNDRLVASYLLLIACIYALGYLWAACQRSVWLARISNTNVLNAALIIGLLIAMFSPLADPARISVNSQMHRLMTGQVSVDAFDFSYLKLHGAHYGLQALEQLKTNASGNNKEALIAKVDAALVLKNAWTPPTPISKQEWQKQLRVWPAGTSLPTSFLNQDWSKTPLRWQLPDCMTKPGVTCDAFLTSLHPDGNDGNEQILLIGQKPNSGSAIFSLSANAQWEISGRLSPVVAGCNAFLQALRKDGVQLLPSPKKDLQIAGQRIQIQSYLPTPDPACPN